MTVVAGSVGIEDSSEGSLHQDRLVGIQVAGTGLDISPNSVILSNGKFITQPVRMLQLFIGSITFSLGHGRSGH